MKLVHLVGFIIKKSPLASQHAFISTVPERPLAALVRAQDWTRTRAAKGHSVTLRASDAVYTA